MNKQDIINQIRYLKGLKSEAKKKYKIVVSLAKQIKTDYDYLDANHLHFESKLKEKNKKEITNENNKS